MSDLCDDEIIRDNNFTNTYSLWGNSKYYDIKNLSPQNFANRNGTIGSEISQEFKAARWTSGPSAVVAPEPPDSRNRRTVDRDSLYEDPDNFYKDVPDESPSRSPTFDWTQFYWHKATEKMQIPCDDQGSSKSKKQAPVGTNKIQKNLNKMLAKPVKMTKAESMMQKMGWQGGALGRTGDGIVEPIAPNAVYAKTKIGFGHNHVPLFRNPRLRKNDSKQYFEMNVLHNIYEFVKNNAEVELLFDKRLRKDERKRIHNLVQYKLSAENLEFGFESNAQLELVLEISDKNCYILNTQSHGIYPLRQLCLYKEAPKHVYLIIPDDLKDTPENTVGEELLEQKDTEDILEVQIEPKIDPPEVTEDLEEETNPFLISITRNLKKTKSESECPDLPVLPEPPKLPEPPELPQPEMSKITSRIVEYFQEFVKDKNYSQFKFLGPFTEEEVAGINEFLEQAIRYLSKDGECSLKSVFEQLDFEVNEDCTGNTVIYKRPV